MNPSVAAVVGHGRSLRTRLLLLLGGTLALVCLVVGSLAVFAINDSLRGTLDKQLLPAAQGPPHREDPNDNVDGVHRARPTSCAAVPDTRDGDFGGRHLNTILACIQGGKVQGATLSPVGTTINDTNVLLSVPANGHIVTRTVPSLGQYRLVARHNGSLTFVTGFPLSEVTTQVRALAMKIALFCVAAILLALALGALLLRRALAPLQRVASVAARVSEMPLERGEVALGPLVAERDADPRTEAGQVGSALNRLLGSVDAALNARHASETRVRQFVADASHELRTPLAAIRGYAELTRRHRGEVPPDTAYAMTRVESEAARMTSLVEDLLLLARLDAGRPLERVPVDVTSLVVDVVSDAHAVSQDHQFELDLPPEPVEVEGDPQRLHQAVANLLSNARTHTPAGTRVSVRIRREGPDCVIGVVDDGPGIPPDLLPDVFERFARGDSSRSRAAGSTGLGLAIVSAIVTAHGGRVTVESRPGRTEFVLRLPVPVSAATPAAVPA